MTLCLCFCRNRLKKGSFSSAFYEANLPNSLFYRQKVWVWPNGNPDIIFKSWKINLHCSNSLGSIALNEIKKGKHIFDKNNFDKNI